MLMHFSGGVLIAMLAVFYARKRMLIGQDFDVYTYKLILLVVFIIALAWEGLEYSFAIYGGDRFILFDTLSDLCFGVAGGIFVLLMGHNSENRV